MNPENQIPLSVLSPRLRYCVHSKGDPLATPGRCLIAFQPESKPRKETWAIESTTPLYLFDQLFSPWAAIQSMVGWSVHQGFLEPTRGYEVYGVDESADGSLSIPCGTLEDAQAKCIALTSKVTFSTPWTAPRVREVDVFTVSASTQKRLRNMGVKAKDISAEEVGMLMYCLENTGLDGVSFRGRAILFARAVSRLSSRPFDLNLDYALLRRREQNPAAILPRPASPARQVYIDPSFALRDARIAYAVDHSLPRLLRELIQEDPSNSALSELSIDEGTLHWVAYQKWKKLFESSESESEAVSLWGQVMRDMDTHEDTLGGIGPSACDENIGDGLFVCEHDNLYGLDSPELVTDDVQGQLSDYYFKLEEAHPRRESSDVLKAAEECLMLMSKYPAITSSHYEDCVWRDILLNSHPKVQRRLTELGLIALDMPVACAPNAAPEFPLVVATRLLNVDIWQNLTALASPEVLEASLSSSGYKDWLAVVESATPPPWLINVDFFEIERAEMRSFFVERAMAQAMESVALPSSASGQVSAEPPRRRARAI